MSSVSLSREEGSPTCSSPSRSAMAFLEACSHLALCPPRRVTWGCGLLVT